MTLTDTDQVAAPPRGATPTPGLSFGRLVLAESRKLTDTRAGLWLLVVIALVTAAAVVLVLATAPPETLTFATLALTSAAPQAILLPILGVLAATAEWSQRTGLVTFTLEPRRLRVGLAKLVAATGVALVAVVLALAVGAAANVAGQLWWDGNGSWALEPEQVGGALLLQVIGVAQGVAFGAAIGNSAVAIVAILVLPTLWTVLGMAIEWLREPARWLDLGVTSEPLLMGTMAGDDWARLATSSGLWVVLPMAIGAWRLVTREVK